MKPQFLVSAYLGDVRLVISEDPAAVETSQSWTLTQSEAAGLRDALTLALAPVGAGDPRLPCRITKGRKACRSCGAVSGQAHTEGCPEVLQPPEEGERRVGPPERRAGYWVPLEETLASRHPATELTYRGTVKGAMQSGPPSVDNLPRRDRATLSGLEAHTTTVDDWPPTPEEKAAGERIKYPPIPPTRCPECGADLAAGHVHTMFCEWNMLNI